MKKYTKISVTPLPFDPENLSGLLWELNPEGIEENEYSLSLYFPFSSDTLLEEVNSFLTGLKNDGFLTSFEVESEVFENKNWNEEWEKSVDIIKVSDRIVICPSFKKYTPAGNEKVITIDPKMSFGTGEHQTTRLVIRLLEKYTPAGGGVLDAGTGTGVLAIAAILLGAGSAIGFDNDEWCLLNAKENTDANNLTHKIDIRLCEISGIPENNFDLILANIQKNILLPIANDIKNHLAPSGRVILSGLLLIDFDDIMDKYSSIGFKLVERMDMDEWMALVLEL
ncbi:MAG: 50S ribosomal protein L11 methyltransferase [Ignavibacteriaceae bacterium]